jgi:hypothetical protein
LSGKSTKINEVIIPTIDLDKTLKEIEKEENEKPGFHRFAKAVSVDIAPLSSSLIESVDGFTLYRLKITASKATSLTLYFDKLILPPKAELFLYNEEGTIITGPISEKENIKEGEVWGSNTFSSSTIVLELKVPQGNETETKFHLGKILFGIKRLANKNLADSVNFGYGEAGPCNVNVVCASANGWEQERQAVCQITTDDGAVGSGFLINNTCNLLKSYLITAWHGTNDRNPSNWTYTFLWFSPQCDPSYWVAKSVIYNGASLRATYEPTDFSLLELNQPINSNSGLSFLGWTRSTTTLTSTTNLSHPQGDQMKYAHDNNAPTIGDIRLNTNTAWRSVWSVGASEGGSSGSPLFEQNHRVIGQLFSSSQSAYSPCNQTNGGSNFGRFDLSWDGGGTSNSRLKDWLDPNNSGAMTTNTTNASALYSPMFLQISGADLFCSGTQTYTLYGAPIGAQIFWDATPSGYATLTPNGTSVNVTMLYTGAITLKASVFANNCNPATKVVHMGTYGSGDYPVSGPGNTNCNYYVTYTTNQLPGATSYTWFYPNTWSYVDGQGTNMLTLIASGTTGNYQVGVRVNNTCGTGGSYAIKNTFLNGCYYYFYSVSPNPATSNVTVSQKESTASNSESKTVSEVKIYDMQGNLKKVQKFNKVKTAIVNTSGLPNGTYFIEISSGDYTERQQLLIQR